MNKLTLKINGEDYTRKVVFPFKFADLLDERLDEAYLSMKNLKLETPFQPLSLVEIELVCVGEQKVSGIKETTRSDIAQSYDNENHILTQTMSKRYVVATDKVNEYPVGSKLYTHDLYIIEETKILEGFIGDSLSFTNALGNNYLQGTVSVSIKWQIGEEITADSFRISRYVSSSTIPVGTILTYEKGSNTINKAKVLEFVESTEYTGYNGYYRLKYPLASTFENVNAQLNAITVTYEKPLDTN